MELLEVNGIGDNAVKKIFESKNIRILNTHIEYLQKNNIEIITIEDEEYPKMLKKYL